jgi:hypothetical protein
MKTTLTTLRGVLAAALVFAALSTQAGPTTTVPLVNSQNVPVGTVTVNSDPVFVYVTYRTTGDWVLTQTDLDVRNVPNLFRLNADGSPNVSSFLFHATHNQVNEYTYVIPAVIIDTTHPFFAARAVVLDTQCCVDGGVQKGNNGLGNGVDPQPPGNPPINDALGQTPGNPGNLGGGTRPSAPSGGGGSSGGGCDCSGADPKANNGLGNGVDPQPPGTPKINDGVGSKTPGKSGGTSSGQCTQVAWGAGFPFGSNDGSMYFTAQVDNASDDGDDTGGGDGGGGPN